MIHDNHLYTAIAFKDYPTLYRIASAKMMIAEAEERILKEERKDVGGVFFEAREQKEAISKHKKAIERLRNYVRNQCITLITQS